MTQRPRLIRYRFIPCPLVIAVQALLTSIKCWRFLSFLTSSFFFKIVAGSLTLVSVLAAYMHRPIGRRLGLDEDSSEGTLMAVYCKNMTSYLPRSAFCAA